MANVTPGRLWPQFGPVPLHTSHGVSGAGPKRLSKPYQTAHGVDGVGHRAYGGLIWAATSGGKKISGRTYFTGVPASRRVLLIKEGPPSFIIGEFVTEAYTGNFNFIGLAPGKYIVLDLDTAKQGMIFDLVVVGP